jgi:hypothetical protein
MSPSLFGKYPALHGLYPRQSIARQAGLKKPIRYQPVIREVRPPQIWPHLPVLVLCSLLRYAASAIQQICPGHAERNSGTGFLAAEMKECDA